MVRSSDPSQPLMYLQHAAPCETCDGTGGCPACAEDRNAAVRRRCEDCSGLGVCPTCQGTGSVVADGVAAALAP